MLTGVSGLGKKDFVYWTKIINFVETMRQNYFNSEIQKFSFDNFYKLLKNDLEGLSNLLLPLSQRVITITKANLGIDRRVLFTWKKNGLLPFRDKIDQDKKFWNRFSFIELCWLKVLIEFRNIGVGIEILKKIKLLLFQDGFFNESLQQIDVKEVSKTFPNFIAKAEEEGLIKDDKFQQVESPNEFLEDTQFSLFSNLLYTTILARANQVLYVDKEGILGFINLDKIIGDPISGVKEVYDILNLGAIATVNIKKIVTDLSGTHEHFTKNLQIGKTISSKSIKVLEEIFKKEGIKEVTIRTSDKGKLTVYLTKEMDFLEMNSELEQLQMKGNFYDLTIRTRDGNINYFEKTELIRF